MNLSIRLFFTTLLLTMLSCKATKDMGSQQKQGIQGQVLWQQGNMMPGPNMPASSNGGSGVQREIYIYKVMTMDELPKVVGGLYPEISANPVSVAMSDEKGNFKIGLPAGAYSVFTKEEGGFFANISNGQRQINPIEVKEEAYSEMKIIVNYKAAY